ncbi:BnaA01g22330D [Brassica napus]|uniref:BnaA01g22330D protein n=1 Tax=Brassica napus TaxID=3708 RepID=A0A078GGW9_BRANA|nr:BnaA01g22330D [Brassica napus]
MAITFKSSIDFLNNTITTTTIMVGMIIVMGIIMSMHKNHVGDNERRKGMLQMICNGNNSCEILSAMGCESCLKADADSFCPQHNKFLCYNCDIKIHLPDAVPPHMRCQLCVTCKRLSPTFLVGTYHFILPPTHPAAVAKETYTPAPHPAAFE